MSGSGNPTNPSQNNPSQPSLSSSGGVVTNMGGTMRVEAGKDPVDVSNTGAVAADTGIDPATGKPKTPEQLAAEAAPVVKTPEQIAAEAAAATKTPEQLAAEAEAAKNAPKVPTPEELEAAKVEAAKTDPRFVPFTEEFMTKGDLSPESRDKAAKDFGVSRSIVDAWVEGQKAQKNLGAAALAVDQVQQDRTVATIKGLIGTDVEYTQFNTWANANLPEADMETLVEAINTNNPRLYTMAMNNAKAQWLASGGKAPRDVTNQSPNAQQQPTTGFASLAEQSAAINDPKYRNDPAHRAIIEARIAASKF